MSMIRHDLAAAGVAALALLGGCASTPETIDEPRARACRSAAPRSRAARFE